jgi:hypothetical protein
MQMRLPQALRFVETLILKHIAAPVASKVLTPGGVGWRWLEKVVDSKRMTPATERNADEQKDS